MGGGVVGVRAVGVLRVVKPSPPKKIRVRHDTALLATDKEQGFNRRRKGLQNRILQWV